MLEKEFLDSELLINHNFDYLVNSDAAGSIDQIQNLFTEVRFKFLELSKFNLYITEHNCPANQLLGFIIRSNLPPYFIQEMVRKTGSNIPQSDEILLHVNDVIKLFSVKKISSSSANNSDIGTKPKVFNSVKHEPPVKNVHCTTFFSTCIMPILFAES